MPVRVLDPDPDPVNQRTPLYKHYPGTNNTREEMDHGVEFVLSYWLKVPYRTPVHNTKVSNPG